MVAKLLTYGGQVIDPTAYTYIYIYIYICFCFHSRVSEIWGMSTCFCRFEGKTVAMEFAISKRSDLGFHSHRVLQGAALHFCGSPDPFSCSKMSLFYLKACNPVKGA